MLTLHDISLDSEAEREVLPYFAAGTTQYDVINHKLRGTLRKTVHIVRQTPFSTSDYYLNNTTDKLAARGIAPTSFQVYRRCIGFGDCSGYWRSTGTDGPHVQLLTCSAGGQAHSVRLVVSFPAADHDGGGCAASVSRSDSSVVCHVSPSSDGRARDQTDESGHTPSIAAADHDTAGRAAPDPSVNCHVNPSSDGRAHGRIDESGQVERRHTPSVAGPSRAETGSQVKWALCLFDVDECLLQRQVRAEKRKRYKARRRLGLAQKQAPPLQVVPHGPLHVTGATPMLLDMPLQLPLPLQWQLPLPLPLPLPFAPLAIMSAPRAFFEVQSQRKRKQRPKQEVHETETTSCGTKRYRVAAAELAALLPLQIDTSDIAHFVFVV